MTKAQSTSAKRDPVQTVLDRLTPAERTDAIKELDAQSIAGFRGGWLNRFIRNAPALASARAGYLSALYALRAEEMPGAFERSIDTERFQRAVRLAIAYLEESAKPGDVQATAEVGWRIA
jgi:hypothetical protein